MGRFATGEVGDRIFEEMTRTFFLDEKNRESFREHNVRALEEIGRRALTARRHTNLC